MSELIIFSPLPPLRNGIADYAHRLVHEHARAYECVVVIADSAPDPVGLPAGVVVLRDVEYERVFDQLRRSRHLFHLGNNADHSYMLKYLDRISGVIVLHDLTLHHLVSLSYFDGVLDCESYRQLIWRDQGCAGELLVRQAWEQKWRSASSYIELPCLGVALENAAAVIVHSWLGVLRVGAYRSDLPVRRIPHFSDIPTSGRSFRRQEARTRLGLPHDGAILLSLGFVTVAKQIGAVMDAVRLIRGRRLPLTYLIVGHESEFSVEDHAAMLGVRDMVRHIDYVPEEEIPFYLDAADILINIRFPTTGETSGSLSRALGRGVCSVVSDHGWYAELPDDVVVKVPARHDVGEILAGTLLFLLESPGKQIAVETAAAAWAGRHLAVDKVAAQYHAVIQDATPVESKQAWLSDAVRLPGAPRIAAAQRILAESPPALHDVNDPSFVGHLWWSEGLVPLPDAADALLIEGPASLGPFAASILGCRTARVREVAARQGLFAGSWGSALHDGTRLAAFCDALDDRGLAAFDFWAGTDEESDVPSVEKAKDLLILFGFDVVHACSRPSIPFSAFTDLPPISEIGLLARRVARARSAVPC